MRDIHIELEGAEYAADFITSVSDVLPDTWSRDGILEAQVSTREDVQYCFRYEPGDERPRTALVLAGPGDTLTVAVVVPIDRDVDLSDDTYDGIVDDFWEDVLVPVLEKHRKGETPYDLEADLVDRDEA